MQAGADPSTIRDQLRSRFPQASTRTFFEQATAERRGGSDQGVRPLQLTQRRKLALGAATLWPVLYSGLFITWWFAGLTAALTGSGGPPIGFPVIIPLHLLTMLETLLLTAVYAFLAAQSTQRDQSQRVLWLAVVILGGFVGQLIFFVTQIWNTPVEPSAVGQPHA